MAKQFGGSISVSSVLGQGASFVLRMPCVTPVDEIALQPDSRLHA